VLGLGKRFLGRKVKGSFNVDRKKKLTENNWTVDRKNFVF